MNQHNTLKWVNFRSAATGTIKPSEVEITTFNPSLNASVIASIFLPDMKCAISMSVLTHDKSLKQTALEWAKAMTSFWFDCVYAPDIGVDWSLLLPNRKSSLIGHFTEISLQKIQLVTREFHDALLPLDAYAESQSHSLGMLVCIRAAKTLKAKELKSILSSLREYYGQDRPITYALLLDETLDEIVKISLMSLVERP